MTLSFLAIIYLAFASLGLPATLGGLMMPRLQAQVKRRAHQ